MLRIEVPSDSPSGLTFSKVKQFDIPAPRDGFLEEIDDNLILQFEDEQDAIDYSLELDRYAESLRDHKSEEYQITGNIIKAISEDEFVRAYIQD
ncbi:MAG: hypothetical protein ACTHJ8_14065 [Mucilaginibacter sp.]